VAGKADDEINNGVRAGEVRGDITSDLLIFYQYAWEM
jgi:hypothetical protein